MSKMESSWLTLSYNTRWFKTAQKYTAPDKYCHLQPSFHTPTVMKLPEHRRIKRTHNNRRNDKNAPLSRTTGKLLRSKNLILILMANKLAEFELLRKELLEHLPYLADDNIFVGYLGLLDNEFNNLINSKYIADGLALSNSILQPYFKTEFPKAKKDVEESEGVEEAEEVEEPSE